MSAEDALSTMFAALGKQGAGLRSNTDTDTSPSTNTDTEEDQAVREWISQLPAASREQLMQELMKDLFVNRSRKVLNTSTDHKNLLNTNSIDRLQALERSWRLLFSPDWRRVALVDLGRDQVRFFSLTFFLSVRAGRPLSHSIPQYPEYRRTCWTLWKKQATCSSSLPDPESKVVVDLLLIEMPPERCQRQTSFGEIFPLSSFSSVFRVVSEESSNRQSFVREIQLETYSRGPPPSFRLS